MSGLRCRLSGWVAARVRRGAGGASIVAKKIRVAVLVVTPHISMFAVRTPTFGLGGGGRRILGARWGKRSFTSRCGAAKFTTDRSVQWDFGMTIHQQRYGGNCSNHNTHLVKMPDRSFSQ
jgi:hypothetical protein